MSNTAQSKRAFVSFAALDQYVERNIVSPREKKLINKDFIEWGDNNLYPEYLLDL